jgi:hypothetical protein
MSTVFTESGTLIVLKVGQDPGDEILLALWTFPESLSIPGQRKALVNHPSAMKTLALYWNNIFPFSSALCSALLELAQVEEILCSWMPLGQMALLHSQNQVMFDRVMQHIKSLRTVIGCEESQIAAMAASFAGLFHMD